MQESGESLGLPKSYALAFLPGYRCAYQQGDRAPTNRVIFPSLFASLSSTLKTKESVFNRSTDKQKEKLL